MGAPGDLDRRFEVFHRSQKLHLDPWSSNTQMPRPLLPRLQDETYRASPLPRDLLTPGLEPGIHAGQNLFTRDHLHRPGIDLVEAALDF